MIVCASYQIIEPDPITARVDRGNVHLTTSATNGYKDTLTLTWHTRDAALAWLRATLAAVEAL